jgi:hypothetical protein
MAKIGQRPDNATGTQDTTQTASQLGVGGQQITITQPTNDNDVTTALEQIPNIDEKGDEIERQGRSRERTNRLEVQTTDPKSSRSQPPLKGHGRGLSIMDRVSRSLSGRHSRADSSMSVMSDSGSKARSAGEARTMKGRVAGRDPELKVKDSRTWGNIVVRSVLGGLGALAGAVGGAGGGMALGGLFTSPSVYGIPVGMAAGAGLGAYGGGRAGWEAGTRLADYMFVQPQKTHVKDAIAQLRRERGEFTEGETLNLEKLSDDKWRKLLHVPSSKGKYTPFAGSGRVKDPKRRQKIRQALVRHIAVMGDYDSAKGLKNTLITAANQPSPPDRPDWGLDQGIAVDRRDTIAKSLHLKENDLSASAKDTILKRILDPTKLTDEREVSAFIVKNAAQTLAAKTDREGHGRAAYAVVAHQAKYAQSAEDFLSKASAPGAASLSQILDRYDQKFLAPIINPVKEEVADLEKGGNSGA